MIRKALRWLGTLLLFLVVALSFAPTLVPPFLDRVYYSGPVSDHFDGRRFFNPGRREAPRLDPRRFFNRWVSGERAVWPDSAPVRQTVPPPGVTGDEMRVTWIGHATVLVQVEGLNILTDPIWSERASPSPSSAHPESGRPACVSRICRASTSWSSATTITTIWTWRR